MTTYMIELYAAPHRLCGVHLVDAQVGSDAIRAAHVDINETGCDHAELFMGDGTGGNLYYTTVRSDITSPTSSGVTK